MTTLNNHEDLLNAFTFMADRPQTLPSDLADQFGHNMRYSREIIATLMEAKIVVLDTSTDFDFYRTDLKKRNPLDVFNKAFKVKAAPKPEAKPKSAKKAPVAKEYHPCGCGCGEMVPPKSAYRPGHDARHAGDVGRGVAASYPNGLGDAGLKGEVEKFISPDRPLLVAKAIKVTHTAWAKAAAKKNASPIEGIVTVGKAEYAATKSGDVVTRVDTGKPVSATAAKTFIAG